jgi:hypothetical protein
LFLGTFYLVAIGAKQLHRFWVALLAELGPEARASLSSFLSVGTSATLDMV